MHTGQQQNQQSRMREIDEFTVKDHYQDIFPYSSLNDVMKIIKGRGNRPVGSINLI